MTENPRTTRQVTIAQNQALSTPLNIGEMNTTIGAILLPAGWDTAGITFQASDDGQTYRNVYIRKDDGTLAEYTILAPAASYWIMLRPDDFLNVKWIKVRSGTSGAPVNQAGGARTILLRILDL